MWAGGAAAAYERIITDDVSVRSDYVRIHRLYGRIASDSRLFCSLLCWSTGTGLEPSEGGGSALHHAGSSVAGQAGKGGQWEFGQFPARAT
jgi:hypothetical protein